MGDIVAAIVEEYSSKGFDEMKLACASAMLAKNRRPDGTGFSPRLRVFGCSEKLPGSVLDSWLDDVDSPDVAIHDLALTDEYMGKTFAVRASAMSALEKMDASSKFRRAITHDHRVTPPPFFAGECVYFWRKARTPGNLRGRRARRFDRWNGPAVVIGREIDVRGENEGYWVAYSNELSLVAPQHLRRATAEEQMAPEVLQEVVTEFGRTLQQTDRGQMTFEDLRRQDTEQATATTAPAVIPVVEETHVPTPLAPVETDQANDASSVAEPMDEPSPMRSSSFEEEVVRQPTDDGAMIPVPEDDNDVLVLELKAVHPGQKGTKGRELDPRRFSEEERKAFRASAQKNWEKHLEHKAVRVVLPDEAALVPRNRILPVPSRFVHTYKEDKADGGARSRWVVPGHLDPDKKSKTEVGGLRTDAPVAPQIAFHLLLILAATRLWLIGSFDIGSAFLTGDDSRRKLYARPPRDGLANVPEG